MQAATVSVVMGVMLLQAAPAAAHMFKFGGCKTPSSVQNFDPVRFNGTWYLHRKLATSSSCMSTVFNWDEQNSRFKVQEFRTPPISSIVPLDFKLVNEGYLTVTPGNGAMKLQWEGIIANLLPYTLSVVDTDYDTYSLNVECQNLMGVGQRVSASVLTRTQEPPPTLSIQEYLQVLGAQPDIDLSRMSPIQQENCTPFKDGDYKVKYDENGLSLLALAGNEEVKRIKTEGEAEAYVNKAITEEELPST